MRLFEFTPTKKVAAKPAPVPQANVPGSAIRVAPEPAPAKSPAPTMPGLKPTAKPAGLTVPTRPTTGLKLEPSSLGSHLEQAAKAAGIVGAELAAFLAQCKVETAGFTALEELPNQYQALYEPNMQNPAANKTATVLGNTQPGDGQRYKGRGYIQLTGRYNYTQFAKSSGIPVDKKPELLRDPTTAAAASIWFWKNKVKPVVANIKNVAAVTKAVNGKKMLGLDQRAKNFKQYMSLLAPAKTPVKKGRLK